MTLLNHKQTARVLGLRTRQLEHYRFQEAFDKVPKHVNEGHRVFYDSEEIKRHLTAEFEAAEKAYNDATARLEELTATAESEAA